MTVQELGEYWMRRRLEEARAPSTGERLGDDDGAVSLQTLGGYQSALSRIINPRLGGLRLAEARTGVVDEALARVDLSGRTTRVARSVLAQMFAMRCVTTRWRVTRCARSGAHLGDGAQSKPSRSSKLATCFRGRDPISPVLLATSEACCWVAAGERPTCTTWCFCC